MGELTTKKCKRCGENKPLSGFRIGKTSVGGYRQICRKCDHNQYNKWKSENREKLRAIMRKSYIGYSKTARYKYCRNKATAKQRGIIFDISYDQFYAIFNDDCFYCDEPNFIGLDRIDSDKGYVIDNICPCCYRCNVAKNTMTQEEFINLCKKIAKKWK